MNHTNASPGVSSRHTRRWLVGGILVLVLLGGAVFWVATRRSPADNPNKPGESSQKKSVVPEGPPWFRDMTAHSGIDFTNRNGEEADNYTILEQLGGGVAMIDYDGDGLLDLFFTGGGFFDGAKVKGKPCKLYRNLGNWKFRDVTAEVGLDKIDFYTLGCAVADYDRDGWPDLVVTGYDRAVLYRNDGGRRFVDVTDKLGTGRTSWSTSAGWADLTGSGFPDLYLCRYCDWSMANNPVCKQKDSRGEREVCTPTQFTALVHTLFRNNGDGTFRDVTTEEHVRSGNGLGVVLADFTGDGRPGIYVANDLTGNFLYLNRRGKLEEKGLSAGVAMDEHGRNNGSMGVDAADYDGSGRASIFVTNFGRQFHALYQNLGKERFSYQSHRSGIASLSQLFVAFGTSFIDIDNDGWEDLIILNGHIYRAPLHGDRAQVPLLLRNVAKRGERVFQNWSERGGKFFATPAVGRGLAVGDLDNDGWPDIVVSNTNSPAVILRNEASTGNPARWLGVQLVGKGHRDVTGTTLRLDTGTRTLTRFSKGGGSYLSASDRRILFGLGASEQIGRLAVQWSWGAEQFFDDLEPGSYWEIREGEKKAMRMK